MAIYSVFYTHVFKGREQTEMKKLLTLVITYTAIVFGFQHYGWLSNVLHVIFSEVEYRYLEIGSFVFLFFFFWVIAQTFRAKSYAPDYKMPLDGTFPGFLIGLCSLLSIIWLMIMVCIKLYAYLDPTNFTNLIVISQSGQFQDSVLVLFATEPHFVSLIKFWLVSGENSLLYSLWELPL